MLSRRPWGGCDMIMVWLTPETGRSRLKRTVPSSSHTFFATNPDHDVNVANQHRDAWGVSQPRCAPIKGSAEHIRPPECILPHRLRSIVTAFSNAPPHFTCVFHFTGNVFSTKTTSRGFHKQKPSSLKTVQQYINRTNVVNPSPLQCVRWSTCHRKRQT